jgi:hypothetical protein
MPLPRPRLEALPHRRQQKQASVTIVIGCIVSGFIVALIAWVLFSGR